MRAIPSPCPRAWPGLRSGPSLPEAFPGDGYPASTSSRPARLCVGPAAVAEALPRGETRRGEGGAPRGLAGVRCGSRGRPRERWVGKKGRASEAQGGDSGRGAETWPSLGTFPAWLSAPAHARGRRSEGLGGSGTPCVTAACNRRDWAAQQAQTLEAANAWGCPCLPVRLPTRENEKETALRWWVRLLRGGWAASLFPS